MASWKKLLHESSPAADFPTLNQSTTGNANTATKATELSTGRTLKVALGSTSASTAFTGAANVHNIGVTGTLGVGYGGTGLTSLSAGDIIYASGSSTFSKLSAGTNGHVLKLALGQPVWAAAATGDVTGIDAGTGITVSDGSTTTPEVAVTAAQTGITSIYNAALSIGAGSNKPRITFDFDGTPSTGRIVFQVDSDTETLELINADASNNIDTLQPVTDRGVRLGGSSNRFAVGYFREADISAGLTLGGTAVTANASELNILDGKSFLDQDNMSSNSATAIASQQSIKAYVDAHNGTTNLAVIAGTSAGPQITSSTGTNATIPSAGASASGIVTTGTQSMAGNKTFKNNVTIEGDLTLTGTSTIENSTIATVNVEDMQIKLAAGTGTWRDTAIVFDRGGAATVTEGVVQTADRDGALWYDCTTGHLQWGQVASDLNESSNTPVDIGGATGTANIHQIALCSASTSAGSGVTAPIGSIHVDTDDDSGTPYIRVS